MLSTADRQSHRDLCGSYRRTESDLRLLREKLRVAPVSEFWIHLVEQGSVHHDHTDITLFEALNGTRAVKILNKLVPAVLEVLKRFLYKAVDPLDSVVKRCIRTDVLVETLREYRASGTGHTAIYCR